MNSNRKTYKINKIKATDYLDTLAENISSIKEIPLDKQLEILLQLVQIKDLVSHMKPDHGNKPLFGYIDKNKRIPFVKLEAVLDYLSDKVKIPRNKIKYSKLWKECKFWLKKFYNLEQCYSGVFGVHGYMLIYKNKTMDEMFHIIDDFINEHKTK